MTISTPVKSFAAALTAAAIYGAAVVPAGAATNTITLINGSNESDVTLVFTARATESFVLVEGYQVNDVETVTNNMVTLSGGGPNLLGSTWQQGFAAVGSNSLTFPDGTSVPGLDSPPKIRRTWTRSTRRLRRLWARATLTASITRTTPPSWVSLRIRCSPRRRRAFRKPPPGPCCFSASSVLALPVIALAAPRPRSRNLAS
jgi:hypothetical protein